MIQIINHFIEVLGKNIWSIVFIFCVIVVTLFALTFTTPLTFDVYQCVQKEDQYKLHNVKYTVKSVVEKNGTTSVKLCINEKYETLHTNLVEK